MKFNKKGSIYIEATMVMPMAFMIVITMLTISIGFYNQFINQVKWHKEELIGLTMSECNYIWEMIDV